MSVNNKSDGFFVIDNSINRLEMIQEIIDGFQDDWEVFIRLYIDKKTVSFKTFKIIWMEHGMNELFESDAFADLQKFSTHIYSVIAKYLNFSHSTYVQSGAIFALYVIHRNKYLEEDAKIRVTVDQFVNLYLLSQKFLKFGMVDVSYAFEYLRLSTVFRIVCDLRVYGLERKYKLFNYTLEKKVFKVGQSLDQIPDYIFKHDEEVNIKTFERIQKEYDQLLAQFKPGKAVGTIQKSSIIEDLTQQLEELQEVAKETEESDDNVEEEKEDDDEMEQDSVGYEKYTMKAIDYKYMNNILKGLKRN